VDKDWNPHFFVLTQHKLFYTDSFHSEQETGAEEEEEDTSVHAPKEVSRSCERGSDFPKGLWFYFCLCIVNFDILLTVHLSITLANDQFDAQIFLIHLLRSSTCACFEQYLAHPQEVKLF
jgi:hypothetical protein